MTNPNQSDIDFTPTNIGTKKTTIFSWGILLGGFLGALFPTGIYYYREINKPTIQPATVENAAILSLAKKIIDRESNVALVGNVSVFLSTREVVMMTYIADIQYGVNSLPSNNNRGNLDRITIENSIQDILAKTSLDRLTNDPSSVRAKIMTNLPKSIVGFHLSRKTNK
jgi:hypothetical protein